MSIPYSYHLNTTSTEDKTHNQVKGIISYSLKELLFEYKVYNENGSSISGLHKFSIDIDQLRKVTFKKSIFGHQFIIKAKVKAFLEPLPGTDDGQIKLKISRDHKKDAANFAEKLNLLLNR